MNLYVATANLIRCADGCISRHWSGETDSQPDVARGCGGADHHRRNRIPVARTL